MKRMEPKSKTRAYLAWRRMLNRCYLKTAMDYKNWGGRGISVCDRWRNFENFVSDMGQPPTVLTLDRINNEGNYEPGNCRWASRREQCRNRRFNRVFSLNGKTQLLVDWARDIGISEVTLRSRIDILCWPLEKALTHPPVAGRRNRRYKCAG